MSLTQLAAQRVQLEQQKRGIKAELADVDSEIRALDIKISDAMHADGVSKLTVGGFTVHPVRNLSIKVANAHQLVLGMKILGHEELLTVHASRLRTFIREEYLTDEKLGEFVLSEDRLPECLRGAISMDEYERIGVRKA